MDTALLASMGAPRLANDGASEIAPGWEASNQAYLVGALDALKDRLRGEARGRAPPIWPEALAGSEPALLQIGRIFSLTGFERSLLLLCAGVELDTELAQLCAGTQGGTSGARPSFGLALAVLEAPHWSALTPASPLRRWKLLDVAQGPLLTQAALRIDERVLHYLAGVNEIDDRLGGLLRPLPPAPALAASHDAVAHGLCAAWAGAGGAHCLVQLCGPREDCLPIIASACVKAGLDGALLAAEMLPAASADLETMVTLVRREAMLSRFGVLVADANGLGGSDISAGQTPLGRLLDGLDGPLVLIERLGRRFGARRSAMLDIRHPHAGEQRDAWLAALPAAGRADLVPDGVADGLADGLAAQFSLSLDEIGAVAAEVRQRDTPEGDAEAAWRVCRARLRTRLDGLARRVQADAGWDQLVLPPAEIATLQAIAAQLRQRTTVYERWGFAGRGGRGLGISALFHGPSGTGKTMAAEVLAASLHLDLYRIDLSAVVSKYIGETEANLRRLFDAAEESGAILLFDEADALFGKRSEVKDSHDRYANIEVSYLLSRMEEYRGLAVLTTNAKSALDTAFLRRLRFAVQFPFPDAVHRAAIWQAVFPPGVPTEGLDWTKLAGLRVAGGNIRSIALNAAFLAADAGRPVGMAHVLAAARSEYGKLERPLTPGEIGGWT